MEDLNRLLIIGMGRSGAAAARAARQMLPGAGVTLCDSRADAMEQEAAAELTAAGIQLEPGRQDDGLLEGLTPQNSLIIKSPGVPREIPLLSEARRRGIPVWGEVEFARRFLPNILVGVTGTNGKTTTTELIGHLLREAGRAVRVAGNVGTALSLLVGKVPEDEILVVELSSFQLEDSVELRPDIAVLLNLSEDHLDRHSGAEDYYAQKKKIFANQNAGDLAVVNRDDPLCRGPFPGQAAVLWFSRESAAGDPPAAVSFLDGNIVADTAALRQAARDITQRVGSGRIGAQGGEISQEKITQPEVVLAWTEAALKGTHNLENALAATAACLSLGLEAGELAAGLRSFPGVRHRLQVVREVAGVTYVNDSKATNVDAAVRALSAFEGPIHLILGGSLKGCSFAPLVRAVADAPVRQVLLIGEAAAQLAADFAGAKVAVAVAGDLETAVARASDQARTGEVVLLAPACASFDQFRDYEQRGDLFISLVERL